MQSTATNQGLPQKMSSNSTVNANDSTSAPVWLITGCGQGIGLAIARHALSLGHNVIATTRNPTKTPELVEEFNSQQAHLLQLDVTSPPTTIEAFVTDAISLYGRIDILVNNAGYCVLGSIEDIPMEKYHQQMMTNFYGPVALIKAILPHMRERRSGTILNISSATGIVSMPGNGVYAASKFALEAISEALAGEIAPFNIRVASFVLGAFKTSFGQVGADVVLAQGQSEYSKEGSPVYERLKYISKLDELVSNSAEKAAAVVAEVAVGKEELRDAEDRSRLLRFVLGEDCFVATNRKIENLRRTWDVQQQSCKRTKAD